MIIQVSTSQKRQVIDITEQVKKQLKTGDSLVHVFVKHTTAAVTTADLDTGTDQDFLDFLDSLVPNIKWRHPHDPAHAPDHLLASVIGPQVAVPVQSGKLQLGTWQRVILVEFDGPREREVEISIV